MRCEDRIIIVIVPDSEKREARGMSAAERIAVIEIQDNKVAGKIRIHVRGLRPEVDIGIDLWQGVGARQGKSGRDPCVWGEDPHGLPPKLPADT